MEAEAEVESEPAREPEPANGTRQVGASGTKAAVELDEWLAWADRLHEAGEQVSSTRAVEDGLASSTSTAKRRLREYRTTYPERF